MFKTTILTTSLITISIFSFITLDSCKKESCYDASLASKYDFCPQDCPGVTGCDGKTYCNTCMANSAGIRVIE